MKIFAGTVLAFCCFCSFGHGREDARAGTDTADSVQPAEVFTDSLTIGRKTHNKIELSLFRTDDSVYVVLNFYAKQNKKWVLKNHYQFEKDELTDIDPELVDFNNDGLNDLTYRSNIAGRSANEIRRLLIYDKKKDQLIAIRKSDEHPNLRYNAELDCIDAFHVYGGCCTVFLKISGDSLKELADVELFDGLRVTTYDDNGNATVILEDSTYEYEFQRFTNYQPLKVDEDYDP